MRFGVCTSLEEVPRIVAAGFDYVEIGASGFSGLSTSWDSAPYKGMPVEATNLFFDSRIKLFGPSRTPYRDYAERTIERAASLGVSVMVIGSGASRMAPADIDGDSAFMDVVADIAWLGRGFGVTIAPESLNRSETNVGNDLRSLAIGLRDRKSGFTADSYHILYEWNADGCKPGLAELMAEQIPFSPSHVHIADLPRLSADAGDPMLQAFAARLKELGYSSRVSLECTRGEGFSFEKTLDDLRGLFL